MLLRALLFAIVALVMSLTTAEQTLARDVPAGPIWNNADARQKCPAVCGERRWDGNWHTTIPGVMSVCSCSGKRPKWVISGGWKVQPEAWGGGTSCSAPGTKTCAPCSVSCPAGKQATCKGGQETSGTGGQCWTQTSCKCE